jgi:hypothetical protein
VVAVQPRGRRDGDKELAAVQLDGLYA